ncbi:MAG: DUF4838 domain-containing protein [Bacteroidales bacterium]|nr:DUF4838 domain-containing protein [Bacteroidales bacterium]
MLSIKTIIRKIELLFLLLVGNILYAQNWPERQGLENYSTDPKPFSIQGQIVVPVDADSVELRTARLLHRHLRNYVIIPEPANSDSLYSLFNPDYVNMRPAIFVGKTRLAQHVLTRKSDIRDNGFILKSDGRLAVIYSLQPMGSYYGAARLLELKGYRMTHHQIPDVVPNIMPGLPVVDEVNNPSFAYREIWYYTPHHSRDYADWHGLHRRLRVGSEGQYIWNHDASGPLRWADNMYVHTFQKLVPAQKYFDSHPEWFTETGGKRVRDGQLCLSNPEVLDTLCANLAKMMAEQPDAQIWSVSNNDNYNVCQCHHCRHMDSLYGGPSGTLIHFINQVARRFPDKTISTLAYQFTRRAPQPVNGHIEKPDSNVNIMFCSIECGRQEAIATASAEASFRRDMEGWAALCGIENEELRIENELSHPDNPQSSIQKSQLYVWDYVVQFRNMWDPFPNLHVLQPNLKYFHDHGVRLMFEQGTGANNVTSWMELREYMLAKLLWDVNANPDSLLHDFCIHHYGFAAHPVEELYREMHRSLIASGQRLDIYGYPVDAANGYLAPEQIAKYQALITAAYDSLSRYTSSNNIYHYHYAIYTDQVVRDRIRFLELSVDYAVLELIMAGHLPYDSTFVSRADRFVADGKRLGLNILHEMGYSLDEYRADIDNYLAKTNQPNLARHCPVTLLHQPDSQYYAGGAQGLTDGHAGILDYRHSWLGFYGDTVDAIVDLGRRKSLHEIKIDFFYFPLSWIFLPQTVNFYVSNNGRQWHLVDSLHIVNPTLLANPEIRTIATCPLRCRARYVQVEALPLPTIPAWHRATGNPAWIFTDEIIVR